MTTIVDALLENPGTYVGTGVGVADERQAAARIVVTALPGGAGVTLDYETFNAADADRVQGHGEHAVVARTHDGGAVYVTAHFHADSVAVLTETKPGVFELGDQPYPFPMAIAIEVPEPGRITHIWSYGRPGEQPVERERAEVSLRG